MSSERGEMSQAAPPLEDENLLPEILLRLLPQPSSLPRASAVCKRWHSLASDSAFSGRFRRHHRRNPPLLGFFYRDGHRISFEPTLESPNRVAPERFSLELDKIFVFLGCRHGLVLIIEKLNKFLAWDQFLVWDPFTGQQIRLAIPPGFGLTIETMVDGAVLRSAAGDVPHFKVVLLAADRKGKWFACVYSSETGVWGNLISTPNTSQFFASKMPAVLVGGSLYWRIITSPLNSIIEFNVETESLSVIQIPPDLLGCIVMRAEGGGLGLLSMSGFTAQFWKRKTNSHGISSWGVGTTIELGKLLSLNSDEYLAVLGFANDSNSVYLRTADSIFIVQLDSLQFKKRPRLKMVPEGYPFESVYAAGI